MTQERTAILYLRDTLKICGPGKTIINTCRMIDKDKFSLIIGSTKPKKDTRNVFLETVKKLGIPVISLNINSFIDLKGLIKLVRAIKKYKIKIVQTHDAQTRRLGVLAKYFTNIIHVTSLHGWIQNTPKQKLGTLLDKHLIRTADQVIVVSEKMKKMIMAQGIMENRISVLHNAIFLEDYCKDLRDNSIRKEFNISLSKKIIAIIGRLSPEKGHLDFVNAAALVNKNVNDVHFLVVGDGPLFDEINQQVIKVGLSDRFTFTGHRTDMHKIYAAIDLLAITSYTEGLPNVLLEAFAYSKPVVSTNVGGISEVISDGENGILVNPGDVHKIGSSLSLLLNNSQLADEYSKNGRLLIEKKFNFMLRVKKLEKIYDEILGSKII